MISGGKLIQPRMGCVSVRFLIRTFPLSSERPVAYIVLKKDVVEHGGFGPGEVEDEIIKFCKTRIAGFKVPARVQLEIELPKTATGKIRKNVLREREWSKISGRRTN